jgi:hypothetical protein
MTGSVEDVYDEDDRCTCGGSVTWTGPEWGLVVGTVRVRVECSECGAWREESYKLTVTRCWPSRLDAKVERESNLSI